MQDFSAKSLKCFRQYKRRFDHDPSMIRQNVTTCCACHEKSHSNFTKYCAWHEKCTLLYFVSLLCVVGDDCGKVYTVRPDSVVCPSQLVDQNSHCVSGIRSFCFSRPRSLVGSSIPLKSSGTSRIVVILVEALQGFLADILNSKLRGRRSTWSLGEFEG